MTSHAYQTLPTVELHNKNKFRNVKYFHRVLRPVLYIQCFFGQCYLSSSVAVMVVVKLISFLAFGFLTFVFVLAVFVRDKMAMWVQFSLYIIPILCFLCGAYIFSSSAYFRMLKRGVTQSVAVRFYVTKSNTYSGDNLEEETDDCFKAAAHNERWLYWMSLKSIIHPLSLEVFQWGAFLIFYVVFPSPDDSNSKSNSTAIGGATNLTNGNSFISQFVGKVSIGILNQNVWTILYCLNWFLSVYIVGFVSFQFVFITRLIVKDTVNLMSLFGKTSHLKLYPTYYFSSKNRNPCLKFLSAIVNFITMDLFNSIFDERIHTDSAELERNDYDIIPSYSFIPSRVLTSPFGIKRQMSPELDISDNDDEIDNKTTPSEACQIFSIFMTDVEDLTSVFVPFMIVLTFFGVTNLITHVGLFVKNDSGHHLTAWTFFRTVLFLIVALRMIACVFIVSSVLGKLPPHINLLKTANKLGFKDHTSPCWQDFIDLVATYRLGSRSFGFPMTMRQVASFVTVMNMGFFIVFAIVKSNSN